MHCKGVLLEECTVRVYFWAKIKIIERVKRRISSIHYLLSKNCPNYCDFTLKHPKVYTFDHFLIAKARFKEEIFQDMVLCCTIRVGNWR